MPIHAKPGKQFDTRVETTIELMSELSPAAIRRRLERSAEKWGLTSADLPSARTIARRRDEYRASHPLDHSEPWTLTNADPEQIESLIPIQGGLLADGYRGLTRDVAEDVYRIRRAAPTLWPMHAYWLAREYAARPESRPEIEILLYCKPWEGRRRDDGWRGRLGLQMWVDLVDDGRIRHRGIIGLVEGQDAEAMDAYRLWRRETNEQLAEEIREGEAFRQGDGGLSTPGNTP